MASPAKSRRRWAPSLGWREQTRVLGGLITPGVGYAAIFLFGIFLIAADRFWGAPPASGPTLIHQIYDFAGLVGEVLAISGVIGAVSQLLWAQGLFRAALADLLTEDAFLDKRNDLREVWRNVTKRVYLQDFDVATPRDREYIERVYQALDSSITQDHDFYAANVDALYLIEKDEKDDTRLKLTKTITFDLIPFDKKRGATHQTGVTTAPGLTIQDYGLDEIRYRVNGDDVPDEKRKLTEIGPGRYVRRMPLSGADNYRIERTVESMIPLDRDPLLHFAAPYVMDGLTLRTSVYVDGIKTFFTGVGVSSEFVDGLEGDPNAAARGNQHRIYPGILLPEQGFVLVVQRS